MLALSLTATPALAQQAATTAGDTQNAQPSPLDQTTAPAGKNSIVITGIRASLRSARDIKKNSDQIVDSISASDIGALPDKSVSEALQRIPGVTLQRTNENRDPARLSAEGGGVFIRGLSWVRSELNGRDIFGARNGRALNFEDISADLLAGIDVYKNPSAELIEGGIGGLVNLRTRKPLDQGQLIAGSIDYTYADLRKKSFWSGNALYSNNWGIGHGGRIGFLVSGSISNLGNRTDSIQTGSWAQRTFDPDGNGPQPAFTGITPNSFGVRRIDWQQKRQTYSSALQIQTSPAFTLTLEGIYTKATPKDTEFLVGDYQSPIPPLAANSYNSENVLVSGKIPGRMLDLDTRVSTRKFITQDYSANARWTPTDRWTFSADVQRVKSSANNLDFTVYTEPRLPATAVFDLSGKSPSLTYDFGNGDTSNPANYWWAAAMDHFERNSAKEWATRADGEYKFADAGGFLRSFRFGGRYTDKEAISRQTGWNWGLLSRQHWMGTPGPNDNIAFLTGDSNGTLVDFNNFFRGGAAAIPSLWFPSSSLLGMGPQDAYQFLRATETQGWGWAPLPSNAPEAANPARDNVSAGINKQMEKTIGGYGLLKFGMDNGSGPFSHFDGNIGLRVVQTRNDATGALPRIGGFTGSPVTVSACQAAAAAHKDANGNAAPYPASICDPLGQALNFLGGGAVEPNAVNPKNQYTDWLPSLNIRFFLQDNLFLRLAAARAIYRPQFYQLNTFSTLNFNFDANGFPVNYGTASQQPTFTGTGASPDLKSQKSDQVDASLEYYFGTTGQLSAAVFYKRVKGYIVALPTTETFSNAAGDSLDFVLTRYVNADKGTVKGMELAYQQFYDFLPRPLDGLGLQANLTYISAKGGANSPVNVFDPNQISNAFANLPLEGMSKWSYNLALMYEKYDISARLAWNWRSGYLLTTSAANINQPVWAEKYGQLDGSVFYNITKNVKLGVQGTNLTKSKTFLDVGYNDFHPRYSWTVSDRRFDIIARANF
ncbi:MAG: TonB-dependent receptor [Pseudomonadota bacterium]